MFALYNIFLYILIFGFVFGKEYNQCTIYQHGCTYDVTVKARDCMVGDSPNIPNDIEKMLDSNYQNYDESNSIIKSLENKLQEKEKRDETSQQVEMKKLEDLETKLVKMMEGLSVRSLRHIRQIRNDLRHMTSSMDSLKKQTQNTVSQESPNDERVSSKSKRELSCPSEFVTVGTWKSCYRFSTFNTTWHEAREYCSAFGADLASLDTLKESYIIDYLIKSNAGLEIPYGWWTSGNYIARNRRWMWTTKHHLKSMEFSRWGPGEPNSRSTAHCLLLYKFADYAWHDGVCTEKHNFICEIENK